MQVWLLTLPQHEFGRMFQMQCLWGPRLPQTESGDCQTSPRTQQTWESDQSWWSDQWEDASLLTAASCVVKGRNIQWGLFKSTNTIHRDLNLPLINVPCSLCGLQLRFQVIIAHTLHNLLDCPLLTGLRRNTEWHCKKINLKTYKRYYNIWKGSQKSAQPTWQFWLFSWSGEVASSGKVLTFLLLKIWSSFFALRSSKLVSTLLRLISCSKQKTEVVSSSHHIQPKFKLFNKFNTNIIYIYIYSYILFISTYSCILPLVFELVQTKTILVVRRHFSSWVWGRPVH